MKHTKGDTFRNESQEDREESDSEEGFSGKARDGGGADDDDDADAAVPGARTGHMCRRCFLSSPSRPCIAFHRPLFDPSAEATNHQFLSILAVYNSPESNPRTSNTPPPHPPSDPPSASPSTAASRNKRTREERT
ncbi:hypothetical protein BHM03_00042104 [Ensete ventricosum]|nr:hypothetical protein BHM03_00042104 [Ensete ventricosum]